MPDLHSVRAELVEARASGHALRQAQGEREGPVERRASVFELFRFYQAALVNTVFGYCLYALLLWLGLGRYPAQALAHVFGTAFNYATYSRHVFRDRRGSPWRFVLAYAGNYALNLGLLALISLWVRSPYAAGLLATLTGSIVNYAVLKRLVFGRAAQPSP